MDDGHGLEGERYGVMLFYGSNRYVVERVQAVVNLILASYSSL